MKIKPDLPLTSRAIWFRAWSSDEEDVLVSGLLLPPCAELIFNDEVTQTHTFYDFEQSAMVSPQTWAYICSHKSCTTSRNVLYFFYEAARGAQPYYLLWFVQRSWNKFKRQDKYFSLRNTTFPPWPVLCGISRIKGNRRHAPAFCNGVFRWPLPLKRAGWAQWLDGDIERQQNVRFSELHFALQVQKSGTRRVACGRRHFRFLFHAAECWNPSVLRLVAQGAFLVQSRQGFLLKATPRP